MATSSKDPIPHGELAMETRLLPLGTRRRDLYMRFSIVTGGDATSYMNHGDMRSFNVSMRTSYSNT